MKISLLYLLVLSMNLRIGLAQTNSNLSQKYFQKISKVLKSQTLKNAALAMLEMPDPITNYPAERSAGGIHDFYSEGDYWWPDPENPEGPYIQKDGQTNPDNFVAHRHAMIRFSQNIGTLTSAYLLTKNKDYVTKIVEHLDAWFVNPETRMNPSLLYAQAIKGRVTGRGIGIIDMIQMIEVAQSVFVLQDTGLIPAKTREETKNWFAEYLNWVTTHPYGIAERDAKNNHGTCWVMQVATFAKLTGNLQMLEVCKSRYREILIPNQMAVNGSFPLELSRTKPYGYSLFNLDAMSTVAYILDIYDFKTSDSRSIKKSVEYLFPFVENKANWPLPPDVMYWNEWPVAQPFLYFSFLETGDKKSFKTWKSLNHFPENAEVIRNLPIRNPLIWLNNIN